MSNVNLQMRVRDLHREDGAYTGFEISNLLISRRGVVRILKRIAGVTITNAPRAWRFGDNDFVHFALNGHTFLVVEPFGDNDCYWIVAEEKAGLPEIGEVKHVFAKHRWLGII